MAVNRILYHDAYGCTGFPILFHLESVDHLEQEELSLGRCLDGNLSRLLR